MALQTVTISDLRGAYQALRINGIVVWGERPDVAFYAQLLLEEVVVECADPYNFSKAVVNVDQIRRAQLLDLLKYNFRHAKNNAGAKWVAKGFKLIPEPLSFLTLAEPYRHGEHCLMYLVRYLPRGEMKMRGILRHAEETAPEGHWRSA